MQLSFRMRRLCFPDVFLNYVKRIYEMSLCLLQSPLYQTAFLQVRMQSRDCEVNDACQPRFRGGRLTSSSPRCQSSESALTCMSCLKQMNSGCSFLAFPPRSGLLSKCVLNTDRSRNIRQVAPRLVDAIDCCVKQR